ncbi:MAG: hypothetical protein HY718_07440, partial [Planctomycetes bacterium]|nr:hypothetical protein [Planctomycetota bacterium]
LGTQAGYGYALLAAAFDAGGQAEAARRHWHDATLLIPVAELVRRFPELGPLAGKHPPAEVPANLMPTYAPPVSERGDAEMGR